ncbi:GAF and ANTAR domain-containing protein [Arthrobacter sp. HMWF013]|uniref:GAF and ANTAR domain-containing protein n=1 Tax=Arthrobacter sp. HMWF013 TaxID=2056849 RepID=UPI0015E7ECF0|nr:GAF and ANTAR domain-containing protein [Arthrobacter sp. HMWF013]
MGTAALSPTLIDLRAQDSAQSLTLLVRAAASALSDVVRSAFDCVAIVPRPHQPLLSAGTSDPALHVIGDDQDGGNTPTSQALAGNPAVITNGYSPHPQWPDHWRLLEEAGFRSMLCVPLVLEPDRFGALTLLSGRDDVFTPGVVAAVMAFGKRAASSYALAEELRTAQSCADQLQSALKSRTTIDVACGVIMAQNRCSYEDAFQILARASSHRNLKVRIVAEAIVENLPGGLPTTHFGR